MSKNDWLPIKVLDPRSNQEFNYSLQCLGSCILRCQVCSRLLLLTPQSTRNIFCPACTEPLVITVEAMMMTPGVIVKAFNVERPFDIEKFLRIESLRGQLHPCSVVRIGYLLLEKVSTLVPTCTARAPSTRPKRWGASLIHAMRTPSRPSVHSQLGWTQVLAVQNGTMLRFYTVKRKPVDNTVSHILVDTIELLEADIQRVAPTKSNTAGLVYHPPRSARIRLVTKTARFTINVGTDLLTSWWQACLEKSVQVARERMTATSHSTTENEYPLVKNPSRQVRGKSRGKTTKEMVLHPMTGSGCPSSVRAAIPTPIIAAPELKTPYGESSPTTGDGKSLQTISTAFQKDVSSCDSLTSNRSDPGPQRSLEVEVEDSSIASMPATTVRQSQINGPRPLRKPRSFYLEKARNMAKESVVADSKLSTSSDLESFDSAASLSSSGTLADSELVDHSTDKQTAGEFSRESRDLPVDPIGVTTSPTTNKASEADSPPAVVQRQSYIRMHKAAYTVLPRQQTRTSPHVRINSKRFSRYYEYTPLLDLVSNYQQGKGLAAALDELEKTTPHISARDDVGNLSTKPIRAAAQPQPRSQATVSQETKVVRTPTAAIVPMLTHTVPLSKLRGRILPVPTTSVSQGMTKLTTATTTVIHARSKYALGKARSSSHSAAKEMPTIQASPALSVTTAVNTPTQSPLLQLTKLNQSAKASMLRTTLVEDHQNFETNTLRSASDGDRQGQSVDVLTTANSPALSFVSQSTTDCEDSDDEESQIHATPLVCPTIREKHLSPTVMTFANRKNSYLAMLNSPQPVSTETC
ncbi:hypothetical protein IWQ62_000762 [Dispira parvispora]|uniref:Uncharacterized protein n=1 Tax=Dispira parvispora TaxID=1520584 RepID=A0A9W8E9B0_9FUNG|nr:hypothetical protein IWQ62_000762 [Dispira parvispora]